MHLRFDVFKRIFLPLAALFLLILWLMPRSAKFNYDYRKGGVWEYEDLVAEFDFPILKSDSELRAERQRSGQQQAIPYYIVDSGVETAQLDTLSQIHFSIFQDYMLSLREDFAVLLQEAYTRGILPDGDPAVEGLDSPVVFVERDKQRRKSAVGDYPADKVAGSNLLTRTQTCERITQTLQEAYPLLRVDSLMRRFAFYDRVQPNLRYDELMTTLVGGDRAEDLSPTLGIVHFGERIVQQGELVTDDILRVIESYRAEFESRMGGTQAGGLELLGQVIAALALVLLFYLSILYTNPAILREPGRFLYLVLIFGLASTAAFLVESAESRLLYMVPFTLTTLYLLAFFKKGVVLPVYVISLLPLLLFAHGGLELFFLFLVGGAVTIYVFGFFNRGWKQFLTALIAFLSEAVVLVGLRLTGGDLQSVPQPLLMLFIGSFLSVAGYPLIYLFEILFNLVSGSRLMELCDTNANKLLRDLAQKAPGTFQHSLQVMNMAEAAIREIGGDALLVRAGALYHDIGKMQNPRCFIENEGHFAGMEPYHNGLSPHDSAVQIVRHVPDGIALAEKHHLPSVVKEFIRTHHGTTCAKYFYTQYLNAGGSPEKAGDFFYDGRKPYTREQAVLMICDSIEAASRTMKDYSQESCDRLVTGIIDGKMSEGQLRDCDISVKELVRVQDFLKTYLAQMYHPRIEYPSLNKKAIKTNRQNERNQKSDR